MRLVKFLRFMEDPKHPSIGPHLRSFGWIGIWHPENTLISRLKLAIVYLNMAFFISQYLKCMINYDRDALNLILQWLPFHIGVVKILLFLKDYKKWERLIAFISKQELQHLSKRDAILDDISDEYIERSRKFTYLLWGYAPFCNITIFAEPYQRNQVNENGTSVYLHVFDGYTPFGREPPGYYCAMFVETVFGNMMSAYICVWDMLIVTILISFAGQLKICRVYCERAVDHTDTETSRRNIAQCHRLHIDLIQYQKEFNDLISTTMFIHLLIVAINLGVQIIVLTEVEKNDFATMMNSLVFIMVTMFELLIFYWHANEVTVQSELASYSTFQSAWPDAALKVQREVALLGLTISKRMVFRAGPFNEISLATFVAILRATYSFYTLLNGTSR